MGPKSPGWHPHGRGEDRGRVEAEVVRMWLQAEKHQGWGQPPGARRGSGRFLPRGPKEEPTCIPGFWPPDLGENKCLFSEASQFAMICYDAPRKCLSHRVPIGRLAVLPGIVKLCPRNSTSKHLFFGNSWGNAKIYLQGSSPQFCPKW